MLPQSFEHRRAWIEQRLLELAEVFAVDLYAYAVMSNHVHVVVHVNPGATAEWREDEVAARWLRAFRPANLDDDELQVRTMLFVGYASGENIFLGNISRKRRRELIKKRVALLAAK